MTTTQHMGGWIWECECGASGRTAGTSTAASDAGRAHRRRSCRAPHASLLLTGGFTVRRVAP